MGGDGGNTDNGVCQICIRKRQRINKVLKHLDLARTHGSEDLLNKGSSKNGVKQFNSFKYKNSRFLKRIGHTWQENKRTYIVTTLREK